MDYKKIIKEHWVYLLVLAVLMLGVNHHFMYLTYSAHVGDLRSSEAPGYHFIQQYIEEGGSFPLWDHKTYSGKPILNLAFPFYHPLVLALSFLFNPYVTFNLTMIFHLLLAAFGMYLLAYDLLQNKRSAVLTAALFSVSPFLINTIGHPFWLYGMSYIPLELWLATKTFKSKNFVPYSVLLGIVFAIHFLSGGVLQWYYAFGFVSFYFIFKILGKNLKGRALKTGIILFILLVVTLSLISIRFLHSQEALSFTNRGAGLPKEEIIRVGHLDMANFVDTFIFSVHPDEKYGERRYGQLGIAGLLLMLFGIYAYLTKNRFTKKQKSMMFFLLLTMVLVSIYATGIFLDYIYNVPGVKAQRGLDRALVVYVVCAVLVAGLAMNELLTRVHHWPKKKQTILFTLIFILVIGNLLWINYPKMIKRSSAYEPAHLVEEISLFTYMKDDPDNFRFHVNEVTGIDHHQFMGSSIPLGLENIYGTYDGVWDSRYFHHFLGSTFQSKPKLWGMLNVKYLTSGSELNQTGFTFVKRFDDIPLETINRPNYEHTAYLYQNDLWMERASFVPTSLVIIGEENSATQLMYGLMLQQPFDPRHTVIIKGKNSVADYTQKELAQYDAIFLVAGSIGQSSAFLLEQYKDQGGHLFPDVLAGQNTLTEQDVAESYTALFSINRTKGRATISTYYDTTPNQMTVTTESPGQWLFVSEKYTLYPGWSVTIDGQPADIHKANGVLSAVFVPEGSSTVHFSYYPASFKKGFRITTIALVLLFIYGIWTLIRRKKTKKKAL